MDPLSWPKNVDSVCDADNVQHPSGYEPPLKRSYPDQRCLPIKHGGRCSCAAIASPIASRDEKFGAKGDTAGSIQLQN